MSGFQFFSLQKFMRASSASILFYCNNFSIGEIITKVNSYSMQLPP